MNARQLNVPQANYCYPFHGVHYYTSMLSLQALVLHCVPTP